METSTKSPFVTEFSPEVTTAENPISGVTFSNLPKLQDGLPAGMQRIVIPPNHLLTPHLHPDTNETTICLSGSGEVGIIEPKSVNGNPIGSEISVSEFQQNQVVFLPQGYPHYFKNTGSENLELLLTFENYNFNIISVADIIKDLPDDIFEAAEKTAPNAGHEAIIPYA